MTHSTHSLHSFDTNYRPRTYFWPLGLKPHPLSSIKGALRRRLIAGALAEDLDADIPRLLLRPSLPEPLRQYVGSLHPSGMGGEYLPDLIPNEVEVARITIASTTQDVTCVYARQVEDGIFLRVVDEYDGDTLSIKRGRKYPGPLSLGELTKFFLSRWNLLDVLQMNFDESYPSFADVLAFFQGSSDFYPEFDELLRYRVRKWLGQRMGLLKQQDETKS